MTRTRRFVGGLSAGYASHAVMMLVGLWLVQFLLRALGQELYGLWLVAGQLLGYLALLDIGVVALLPRQAAWATGRAAREDASARDGVADVLAQALRVVLWQTPVVALIAAGLWLLLPDGWTELRGPLGIVLIAFVVTFPLRAFEAMLRGLQDLAWVAWANFASWLANIVAVVVLVVLGYGLYSLAAGWIVGRLGLGAASWIRLTIRYPDVLPRTLPPVREAARVLLGRGVWISISQIAHTLLTATDLLLIGAVLGPAVAVPYAITGKLITALAHYPQALVQTAGPGVSEVRAAESLDRVRQVATALAEAMLVFSGGLVCLVLAVNEGFVIWWVGAEHWGGLALSGLILARVLVGHWVLSLELALFAFGHERRLAITSLVNGAVTVVASVVLLSTVGLEGPPLAGIAGLVVVSAPAYLALYSRETGTSVTATLVALWPWAWRFALAALVAGLVIAPRVRPTVPSLALASVAAVVAYVALVAPRLARPPLSIYLHPRIVSVARRLGLQGPR